MPFELSRIDYRRSNGRDYQFAWGTSVRGEGSGWFDQLAKIDVTSGDVRTWSAEGCHPGEPILIRRPGGEAEDDGVILSVVLDAANERSFLAVLDAATMEELARAEAHLVYRTAGKEATNTKRRRSEQIRNMGEPPWGAVLFTFRARFDRTAPSSPRGRRECET